MPVESNSWDYPSAAWQRLYSDYTAPFSSQIFLIVVNSYIMWPEVIQLNSTTSLSTIKILMKIFATHAIILMGKPE